jgi:hypothetical protein
MDTTYYISVLGNLWMPQTAVAAMELKLTKHSVSNYIDFDFDAMTMDDVIDWMYKETGDFSKIIDFEVIKVMKTKTTSDKQDDGWIEISYRVNENTARPWENLDSAEIFHECMHPLDWD